MADTFDSRPLRDSVGALNTQGVVPAIAERLNLGARTLARRIGERVVAEVDAFSNSANPDVLPQLNRHLDDVVAEVARLLTHQPVGDFAFVRLYARERARQRFPLEASLHTYRSAHRIIFDSVRDAALQVADPAVQVRRVVAAAADFSIEFTNVISTIATAEYVRHTRLLAEAEGDRRTELLTLLLSGYDEADSRIAGLLRRTGYLEQRQSFCVVLARSVNPREMQSSARAQRMLEAVGDVLRDTPVRALSGVRDGLVTMIVSGTRRLSGWTAPQSLLAERIFPKLEQVGPAAIIGLSNDAPSTSHVPRAYREAQLALDVAHVANRVVAYADIPFRQMVLCSARDHIQPALPAWLEGFRVADRKARGALSTTLRAYADANMNALQTAKGLSLHANTIYARMQRISAITGKNPLAYHDLTEMLLVLDSD